MVCLELNAETQSGNKVEVWLDDEVVFAEANTCIELYFVFITLANVVDKTSLDLTVFLFWDLKTLSDFFWKSETNVANRLALKDLLCLEELISHELFKIIIENEVLELGELHGHDLLLYLAQDVVCFTRIQVALHVHFLTELSRD